MEARTQSVQFNLKAAPIICDHDIKLMRLVDISDLMQHLSNERKMYVTPQSISYIQGEAQLNASDARIGMACFAGAVLSEVVSYAQSRGGNIDKHTFFYETKWDESRPAWAVISALWNEDTRELVFVFGFQSDMTINGFIGELPDLEKLS